MKKITYTKFFIKKFPSLQTFKKRRSIVWVIDLKINNSQREKQDLSISAKKEGRIEGILSWEMEQNFLHYRRVLFLDSRPSI